MSIMNVAKKKIATVRNHSTNPDQILAQHVGYIGSITYAQGSYFEIVSLFCPPSKTFFNLLHI